MKKVIFAVLAICVLSLAACKKDGQNNNGTNEADVKANATSGSWVVTNFVYNGSDNTTNLSGFTFTFKSDNTVQATNGLLTQQGTWTLSSNNGVTRFAISFPAGSLQALLNISQNWQVVSTTSNSLSLRNDNTGGTNILLFER